MSLIETKLSEFLNDPRFKSFYIGQTNDFESSAEDHKNEGYNYVWKIAYSNDPATIDQAEIDLIQYFKRNHVIAFENINGGGAGNKSNVVYVAVRAQIGHIDDLYDDAFDIDGLNIELPNVNE